MPIKNALGEGSFSVTLSLMAKLCLLFFLATNVWASSDWETAIRLAEEGKNTEASALFLKNLEKSSSSYSTHYNAAVLAVRSEDWSASVVHLLESAKRTANPFTAYRLLDSVSRIQNTLLIQAPASQSASALVKFLVPDRFLLGTSWLCFWVALFCFSFFSKRKAFIFGALCLAAVGVLEAKRNLQAFAVVSNAKGEALYNTNELSEAVTTLPAGTLLVLGTQKESAREVLAPFVGWVQTASLTQIN